MDWWSWTGRVETDKMPSTAGLLSMVLEARYPRSRCWQGCFLLRTSSLACGSFDLYWQGHQSCWIRAYSNDFILTWWSLWRLSFQMKLMETGLMLWRKKVQRFRDEPGIYWYFRHHDWEGLSNEVAFEQYFCTSRRLEGLMGSAGALQVQGPMWRASWGPLETAWRGMGL